MFDKAYICFPVECQIDSKVNRFSLDGGKSVPIVEGVTYYKIAAGSHTLVVTSGNGGSWTVECDVRKKDVLTVKLDIWNDNVIDVLYKFGPPPFGVGLIARKLPE